MIAQFITWWLACMSALLSSITGALPGFARRMVVVEVTQRGETIAFLRHRGRLDSLTLAEAARFGRRIPVVLCPASDGVLTRSHVVPVASRHDMQSILRHELARITPFAPEELLWRWHAVPHTRDPGRMVVTLAMIPRVVVEPVILALGRVGLVIDLVELERRFVPLEPAGRVRRPVIAALAVACVVLASVSVGLPALLQSLALANAEAAIAGLRPALREVAALRRREAEHEAGQRLLGEEGQRVGDPLSILAALNRALPDDCYLTNLALLGRRFTLSGRSPSAAHLITVLAADPGIHDPAFAAPVLRGDGPAGDVFLIKASAAP